jgi:hypothetical protein
MRAPRNPVGCGIAFLAACAIAFSSIALNATWWRVEIELQSAGSSGLSVGDDITAKFYQTNIVLQRNGVSAPSVEYGNIDGFGYHDFNCIKGINIALVCLSCVVFLFGVGSSGNPEKLNRLSKPFSFLSFAGFALALTTLLLTTDVPNEAGDSFSGLSSGDVTFPTFSCGGSTLVLNGKIATGSAISCNDIWETNDYTFTSDSSAVVEFKTKAGSGWWWMVGATLAFALLTKLIFMQSLIKYDEDFAKYHAGDSQVELNEPPQEAPMADEEPPMVDVEPPMYDEIVVN